jgi:methionine-rich copper-binding protein CopC
VCCVLLLGAALGSTREASGITPPGDFDLIAPAGAMVDSEQVTTFTWESSADVTTYALSIALDSGFAQLALLRTGLTGTTDDVAAGILVYNTLYYWKVTAINAAGTTDSLSVFTFTTAPDMTPPSVVITTPSDGATGVPLNEEVRILFSEPIDVASVTAGAMTVVGPAGALTGAISMIDDRTLVFTPDADLAAGAVYTVTVATTIQDLAGNALAVGYTATFTAAATGVFVTIQATRDRVCESGTVVASLSVRRTSATPEEIVVPFAVDASSTATEGADFTLTPVGGSVIIPAGGVSATIRLDPEDDALQEGAETATLVLLDGAGYDVWSDAETTVLIVDDETPPSSFALDWPPDGAAFLDKDIENFFYWTASDNVLEYDFSIAADASFTQVVHTATTTEADYTLPQAVLQASTVYYWRVVASSGVVGTQCASDFSFTTVADTTPPTVVDTSPNADATRVSLTAAITVTFSEQMDLASTVDAITVSTGGAPVAGAITLSTDGRTLTFTPASDLEKGTAYDVVVAQTATDQAGNPLSADFSFQFETSTPLTIPGCLPGAASAAACVLLAFAAAFVGPRRRRVLTRRT